MFQIYCLTLVEGILYTNPTESYSLLNILVPQKEGISIDEHFLDKIKFLHGLVFNSKV